MDNALNLRKYLIIFGTPLFIITLMVFIAKSSFFSLNPAYLSAGITFDLLITVPLLYFLLIRKKNIPKVTVIPFLVIGIIVCSFIIPIENQYYLDLFKTWALPIIELSIVSFVIFNIRKAVKHYKSNKSDSLDFFTTLKKTCSEILPRGIATLAVTEIAVFYYGFIYWKKRKTKNNEFTYHRESGTVTLLIAIIFIVAIETFTLHVLISKWSPIFAWILTIISMYSAIQIFGFLKSMSKRPIAIKSNRLYIRYGIMAETIIDINNIASIQLSSKDIKTDMEIKRLSFLGQLESHNVIINLKETNELTGLYGIKKKYKTLMLYVDDKFGFENQINNALHR